MIHHHFWMGLMIGLLTSYFFSYRAISQHHGVARVSIDRRYFDLRQERSGPSSLKVSPKFNESHHSRPTTETPLKHINLADQNVHRDNATIAEDLYKKVRILCWVMTSPSNLATKAAVVKDTWGRRCNKLLFFSSQTNSSFPAIGLNVLEGRTHLTAKTMHAFAYIYRHHLNDADWFIKTDDDTYVILENLRYFLSSQNSSRPVSFGQHFVYKDYQYHSGGAGYVISKEALIRYGEKGNNSNLCSPDGGSEDLVFGECMKNLGVQIGNTTDSLGRSRFHCFEVSMVMSGVYPDWYYTFYKNKISKGVNGISDYTISFHYVSPSDMYVYEFLVYHMRPYGIVSGAQDIN